MSRIEIRLSGFGGQGLIMAGYVLGKAAAVYEGRHATLNQSFGPEARGSSCAAQLVISDDAVSYPYVHTPDILVAMSQDAYNRFVGPVREDGFVLIEDALVTPDPDSKLTTWGLPATRIAESLGRRIMANMVMVGFASATTGIVSEEAVREAVRTSVPSGTEEKNLAAFEEGFARGKRVLGGTDRKEMLV